MEPVKVYRLVIISITVMIVCASVTILFLAGNRLIDTVTMSDRVRLAREEAEINKIFADLVFWQVARPAILVTVLVAGLIYVVATAQTKVKQAKVHKYVINASEVWVHERDLGIALEITTRLATAEQIGAYSEQRAVEILEGVARLKSRMIPQETSLMIGDKQRAIALQASPFEVPTFAELYSRGEIAPGRPLCLGYSDNRPQHRHIKDIRAMSIAGWQGSGKTLSMGYISVCLLVQYPDSIGYVIDPHREHPESLGALLRPLELSGRLHIVNPLDLPETMRTLDAILDARLAGEEPSAPLIFILIDELSRLGRTEIFHAKILPFVERCTEEARKANMLFLGSGQKWQAKYFGNDASFRQAIPSLLIHKSKPSQAKLLLEDDTEKKMVKQLTRPGEALLATSHDADPSLVKIPLITKADIYKVAHNTQQTDYQPQDSPLEIRNFSSTIVQHQ